MSKPIRIAMWSGPRNLSTAMIRSFGARADTSVIDEPFYAPYLSITGRNHPMRDEVLANYSNDPDEVAASLIGPAPENTPIFFQKHMVQHMVPGIPRDWFAQCRHAILIRHPARALASFANRIEDANAADLGLGDTENIRAEIIERTGHRPPIVEAEDIRNDPQNMLTRLCAALDIPYDPAMLAWQAGILNSDGIWARHWYSAVARSTHFTPAPPGLPDLPPALQEIADGLLPAFERLQNAKIRP